MNEALSFEEFVGARADALMRYAYVLTGDPHDAADLLQESPVRVRAAWHGIDNKREPEGYVRTTMARLHISVWRVRRRERLMSEPPEQAYDDTALARADGDDACGGRSRGCPASSAPYWSFATTSRSATRRSPRCSAARYAARHRVPWTSCARPGARP